jgi:NADH-quinone oxidoreductase subunit L
MLSIIGGFVELPDTLGGKPLFSFFVRSVLPEAVTSHDPAESELLFQIIASLTSLAGIFLAYLLFLKNRKTVDIMVKTRAGAAVHAFWSSGWGFDWLYDTLFVRPFVWAARINKSDFIDLVYRGIAWLSRYLHLAASRTQSGKVRWYAMGIAVGAVVILGIVVLRNLP